MIHFLFVGIPSMLFEPIAVGLVLGGVTTLSLRWKKQGLFYWIILLTFFFMAFWRLAAFPLMLSSRYASIFLYFGLILTACFCFQIKDIVVWLIQKFPSIDPLWMRRATVVLQILLFSGITILCLKKCLHYNAYGDYTVKLCKVLAQEIAGKEYLLYTKEEPDRIAYYSGIDWEKVRLAGDEKLIPFYDLMKQKLSYSKNFFIPIYFIFHLKKGQQEPTLLSLDVDPAFGKLECIHREFTSRKKNKEMVLFRFVPAHPNIEIWNTPIPAISPNNLCENGDFEQALEGNALEQRIKHYRTIGASDFYTSSDRQFPKSWWLGVSKENKGRLSPEMALTTEQPIAGVYSMELRSNSAESTGMNSVFIEKQDGLFTGYLRAKEKSDVIVSSCCQEHETKKTVRFDNYQFSLSAGETYKFTIPVHRESIPKESQNLFIIIQCTGHIIADNIEFKNTANITSSDEEKLQ